MAISDIVKVNITRETTSVAVAAFNVPLILSTFATSKTTTAFTRARVYATLGDLEDDGWTGTDAVYKMARAIFSQNPCVARVVVGRADSGDADVEASLAAIQAENNIWYGVLVDQAMASDASDVAAWVEAHKRFGIYWTDDANTPDGTKTTDLASVLKTSGYDRAAVVYHPTPSTGADYPDAAWMGEGFPYEPGSSTWAYKQLKGVAVDNITPNQETALKAKNCNFYCLSGGVGITLEGKVASGEWIDIIIGTDWIEARIREEVFAAFVNNRKVPYDDNGITMVEGIIKGVLNDAADLGIIQRDSIKVTVPKYKDIPQADKLARKLSGIKFFALYLGAIHAVSIDGTLSV